MGQGKGNLPRGKQGKVTPMLSRRGFLAGVGGLATLPVPPVSASAVDLASASAAEIIASSPARLFLAPARNALSGALSAPREFSDIASWIDHTVLGDARTVALASPVDQTAQTETKPCCSRCGYGEDGTDLFELSGELSCDDCLGYGEAVAHDEDRGIRKLAEFIVVEGEEFARETVGFHEDDGQIDESVWRRAVELSLTLPT
jgi:hypothetical protein